MILININLVLLLQDSRYPVAGLLSKDAKKWLSDPHDKSGQVEVVLQLEKACCLDFIDLGKCAY